LVKNEVRRPPEAAEGLFDHQFEIRAETFPQFRGVDAPGAQQAPGRRWMRYTGHVEISS